MKKKVFLLLIVLNSFGFTGCYLESILEGASVKSFSPNVYIALPNGLESKKIILKLKYTRDSYGEKEINNFIVEEKKETEIIELRENFPNATLFTTINDDKEKIFYFGFYSINIDRLDNVAFLLEMEIYDTNGKTSTYSGNVTFSKKIKSGHFSEHKISEDFEVSTKDGDKLDGVFTYLLTLSM